METRFKFTTGEVGDIPFEAKGQKIYRDTAQPGLLVIAGTKSKSYVVQIEHPVVLGKRRSTRKVIARTDAVTAQAARAKARALIGGIATGAVKVEKRNGRRTLADGWAAHKQGLVMQRKAPRTIVHYQSLIDGPLARFLKTTLRDLSLQRAEVQKWHYEIGTAEGHPIKANGAAKLLRAIYNTAVRDALEDDLPAVNPVSFKLFPEERRSSALKAADLPKWNEQRLLLDPVRAEFHLFLLLTALRPNCAKQLEWTWIDFDNLTITFPRAVVKAAIKDLEIPISKAILACLNRAREGGLKVHPASADKYVFPAPKSANGHLVWHQEPKAKLSHFGGSLRQGWRSAATILSLGEIECHLLMGHSLQGVNANYNDESALTGVLREAQEKVSEYFISGLGL